MTRPLLSLSSPTLRSLHSRFVPFVVYKIWENIPRIVSCNVHELIRDVGGRPSSHTCLTRRRPSPRSKFFPFFVILSSSTVNYNNYVVSYYQIKSRCRNRGASTNIPYRVLCVVRTYIVRVSYKNQILSAKVVVEYVRIQLDPPVTILVRFLSTCTQFIPLLKFKRSFSKLGGILYLFFSLFSPIFSNIDGEYWRDISVTVRAQRIFIYYGTCIW